MDYIERALRYGADRIGKQDGYSFVDDYNELVKGYGLPFPRGYAPKHGDAWCAIFTSVCYMKAGVKCFPIEVGAHRMAERFAERYRHKKYIMAQPGDLVFYDWNYNGWYDHVGIIYEVDDYGVFTTLEGNFKRGVGLRDVRMPENTQVAEIIDVNNFLWGECFTSLFN